MFLVILLYALLALTFTLGKAGVSYADPVFLIAIRMILGGLLLLAFYGVKNGFKHKHVKLSAADYKDFAQVIFFHIYLSFIPEFWALQYISSVKVNIIYAMTPFVALFFGYILYHENVTKSQLFGTILAFASLLPLMLKGERVATNLVTIGVPELMVLVSVISGAYAWFVIKDLMNRGYSLLTINGCAMLGGGILSFMTWLILHSPGSSPVYEFWPFVVILAALILLSNIIVYNLYGWLLRFYSVSFVSCVGFLCPLFGAIYGKLFLNESLGWQHIVAFIGITIGLYLFFHNELRIRYRARKSPLPPAGPMA